jgi:hypothetical protein
MTQCCGITKQEWRIQRCRNPIGRGHRWFCEKHARQPIYLIVVACIAVFFNYIAALIPTPAKGDALVPADFQVLLEVSAHGSALEAGYEPPQVVAFSALLGSISIHGNLERRNAAARESKVSRNPRKSWDYVAREIFVDGLRESSTVRELVGQTLTGRVPVRAFAIKEPSLAVFRLHVFVRGRDLSGKADDNGAVELPLTRELLTGG